LSGTRLALSPSWSLAGAILALHAAAAASVIAVLQGPAAIALGCGLVLLGLAAAWARALHRSGASVRTIEISSSGAVLELGNGRRVQAELSPGRHVSRFMVTLRLRRPMRRTLLVTADMLGAEEFRRLRLWALWGKLPVAAKQLPA
jgi:hypothetical protein